jgi:hypothetical protein
MKTAIKALLGFVIAAGLSLPAFAHKATPICNSRHRTPA